MPLNALVRGKW